MDLLAGFEVAFLDGFLTKFLFVFPFWWLCLCTGSGFVSQDLYHHGFFSASIKLPADYAAGVVVAFYVSNPAFHLISFFKKYLKFSFNFPFSLL